MAEKASSAVGAVAVADAASHVVSVLRFKGEQRYMVKLTSLGN